MKRKLLIFNYHRIGKVDIENPLHRLHTISYLKFYLHIKIFQILGSIVGIESPLSKKLNFLITFDDVPSSFKTIVPLIKKKKIPIILSISTNNASNNYGIRDKVYFIEKYLPKSQIFNYFLEQKMVNSSEFIKSLALVRGTQIGVDFAESFEVIRWKI